MRRAWNEVVRALSGARWSRRFSDDADLVLADCVGSAGARGVVTGRHCDGVNECGVEVVQGSANNGSTQDAAVVG
jgi:hypothetical protein